MELKKIMLLTIKKYKLLLFFGVISSMANIALALYIPFINQSIVDDGIFAKNIKILLVLCCVLALMHLFEYLLKILSDFVFTKIVKEYTKKLYHKSC